MRVARRDAGGARFYLFSDQLGSLRVMTDSSGTIVQEVDYYAFGQAIYVVSDAATDDPYLFTGHELDSESTLYYFQFRMLSANLGRWTATDPVLANAHEPQSLQAYGYVVNNPVNFIDPDGRFHIDCFDILFDPHAPPSLVEFCAQTGGRRGIGDRIKRTLKRFLRRLRRIDVEIKECESLALNVEFEIGGQKACQYTMDCEGFIAIQNVPLEKINNDLDEDFSTCPSWTRVKVIAVKLIIISGTFVLEVLEATP